MQKFLPVSKKDLIERGIQQLDYIIITGDSYVDHPAFGTAIISRVVENEGYTIGVISQPDWRDENSIKILGKPKYAFLINAGNIDSMVAHYTVAKRKRNDDAYTAGGKSGKRPDRAVTVYSNLVKKVYSDMPVVIGGLEASLRRFSHYDYWKDEVMPSILEDSKADLLIYGMGELQIKEIVNRLSSGENIATITDVNGTAYLVEPKDTPWGAVQCPDYKTVKQDKMQYVKAEKIQIREQDEVVGKTIIQRQLEKMLVQNPPMRSLTQEEMDKTYALPYARKPHPMYEKTGEVPGFSEVEFSVTHNRGCFGGCNFCAITLHQGRRITTRSEESVLDEIKEYTKNSDFKGIVSDIGGPTANFRKCSCNKQDKYGMCKDKSCLAPTACKNLNVESQEYLDILKKAREIKGVKKVFVRSGIRYDYMLKDENNRLFEDIVKYHVSGQLRVAPEHCVDKVLDAMGKPHIEDYIKFSDKFYEYTKKIGKDQYLVPYLISSHPGCDLNSAVDLAVFLKKHNLHPDQVQDFYPTPGTVSTCMYYTGINPLTDEQVYVPKTEEEKAMQRALLQYYLPKNKQLVEKALKITHRNELIGSAKNCLITASSHIINNKNSRGTKNGKKRISKK